ncbi:hypothetical protein PQQ99_02595 [Paraburkholderia sediminicola]|uniref:hypothetical protein n=1 Tax=Paraburkholderia sediminicola TaxID=458836 RepID=UPI0038BBD6B9
MKLRLQRQNFALCLRVCSSTWKNRVCDYGWNESMGHGDGVRRSDSSHRDDDDDQHTRARSTVRVESTRRQGWVEGPFGSLQPLTTSRESSHAGGTVRIRQRRTESRYSSLVVETPAEGYVPQTPAPSRRRSGTTNRSSRDQEQLARDLDVLRIGDRFGPLSVTYSPVSPREGWTSQGSEPPGIPRAPEPTFYHVDMPTQFVDDDQSTLSRSTTGTALQREDSMAALVPQQDPHAYSGLDYWPTMAAKTHGSASVWTVSVVTDSLVSIVTNSAMIGRNSIASGLEGSLVASLLECSFDTLIHAATTAVFKFTEPGKKISAKMHSKNESRKDAVKRVRLTAMGISLAGGSNPMMKLALQFAAMAMLKQGFDEVSINQEIVSTAVSSLLAAHILGAGAFARYRKDKTFKDDVDEVAGNFAKAVLECRDQLRASYGSVPQDDNAMELGRIVWPQSPQVPPSSPAFPSSLSRTPSVGTSSDTVLPAQPQSTYLPSQYPQYPPSQYPYPPAPQQPSQDPAESSNWSYGDGSQRPA